MTLATGRPMRKKNKTGGFTLLEVLVALGVFSVGLVMAASALSRPLWSLGLVQGLLSSTQAAEQILIREALRTQQGDWVVLPSSGGSALLGQPQIEMVRLKRAPLPDLEIEQVTAQVLWTYKNQLRQKELFMGQFPPPED